MLIELLEETRAQCRQLELESERRQLEAQDGWAAAAQLKQHLRDFYQQLNESADSDAEDVDEPTELSLAIRSNLQSLKNEYRDLEEANTKNKELIIQLTGNFSSCLRIATILIDLVILERLSEIDQHSRPPASPGEIEYLKNEIAVLTIQLTEYINTKTLLFA